MNLFSFDFETTCKTADNFGHPFDQRNRAVLLCGYDGEKSVSYWEPPFIGPSIKESVSEFQQDRLYCAFNAKFDIHWLRRETGFQFPLGSIWCCQVAETVLTRQLSKMPSLNEALARYSTYRIGGPASAALQSVDCGGSVTARPPKDLRSCST